MSLHVACWWQLLLPPVHSLSSAQLDVTSDYYVLVGSDKMHRHQIISVPVIILSCQWSKINSNLTSSRWLPSIKSPISTQTSLPWHVSPFPVYPLLHLHPNAPNWLLQSAFTSHVWSPVAHSSYSVEVWFEINMTLRPLIQISRQTISSAILYSEALR